MFHATRWHANFRNHPTSLQVEDNGGTNIIYTLQHGANLSRFLTVTNFVKFRNFEKCFRIPKDHGLGHPIVIAAADVITEGRYDHFPAPNIFA